MSAAPLGEAGGKKKKAQVSWKGKKIYLGTFESDERDRKLREANAFLDPLREKKPPPDSKWIFAELKRRGWRVVEEKQDRRVGENEEEERLLDPESPLRGGVVDSMSSIGIGLTPSDDPDSLMLQRRSPSIGSVDDPTCRPFIGGGSATSNEAAPASPYRGLGAHQNGQSGSLGMGGGGGDRDGYLKRLENDIDMVEHKLDETRRNKEDLVVELEKLQEKWKEVIQKESKLSAELVEKEHKQRTYLQQQDLIPPQELKDDVAQKQEEAENDKARIANLEAQLAQANLQLQLEKRNAGGNEQG